MELRDRTVVALAVIAAIAGTVGYRSWTGGSDQPTTNQAVTGCLGGASDTGSMLSKLGDEELRAVGAAVLAAEDTSCAMTFNTWASENLKPWLELRTT